MPIEPIAYAQTNVQLYEQLRRLGHSWVAIRRVRDTYEFAASLYAGRLESSGRPFLCHLVGVASILARYRDEPELVSAGLIHSIYRNEGLERGSDEGLDGKRGKVVAGAGAEIESVAYRFFLMRRDYRGLRERLATLDAREADVALMLLADELEKLGSLHQQYRSRWEDRLERIRRKGAPMVALARDLGFPPLADELAEAIEATEKSDVPPELRGFARDFPPVL